MRRALNIVLAILFSAFTLSVMAILAACQPPPSLERPGDDLTGSDEAGPTPNDGWIGGACASSSDCVYVRDPICLTGPDHPGGSCSTACDRLCPDRDGENSVTFCVAGDGGGGRCVSRCDEDLYPGGGCREGYRCDITARAGEPGTKHAACVPASSVDEAEAETACHQTLEANETLWQPWDYTPMTAGDLVCDIEDPIWVSGAIGGVTYRYYNQQRPRAMAMSCALAAALHDLGDILDDFGIVAVLHLGTTNCRTIAGTNRLSQHAFGAAIDIWGFVDADGQDYVLERDWEHDTDAPRTAKGQVLRQIAQQMHEERVFNTVLTPDYNAGHDNHFHVDLAPGAHFIGQLEAGGVGCHAPE